MDIFWTFLSDNPEQVKYFISAFVLLVIGYLRKRYNVESKSAVGIAMAAVQKGVTSIQRDKKYPNLPSPEFKLQTAISIATTHILKNAPPDVRLIAKGLKLVGKVIKVDLIGKFVGKGIVKAFGSIGKVIPFFGRG